MLEWIKRKLFNKDSDDLKWFKSVQLYPDESVCPDCGRIYKEQQYMKKSFRKCSCGAAVWRFKRVIG